MQKMLKNGKKIKKKNVKNKTQKIKNTKKM